MEKVKFYGRDKDVPGTLSCRIGENKEKDASEYEYYNFLRCFIMTTDIHDVVEFEYININDEILAKEPMIAKLVDQYDTFIIEFMGEYMVGKIHNAKLYVKLKQKLENR